MSDLGKRLQAARIAAGFKTARQFADKHRSNPSTLTRHESGERGFNRSTARHYAQEFGVSLAWLLTGEGRGPADSTTVGHPATEYVEVVGAVQAGIWREAIEWPAADRFTVPTLASARFPGRDRFALQVRGDSMNLCVADGSIVFCVRIVAEAEPRDNDLVVVQRGNDTGDVEATLKRLKDRSGVWWLMPESDNPEHAPIRLGAIRIGDEQADIPGTAEAGDLADASDAEVIAIVDQMLVTP